MSIQTIQSIDRQAVLARSQSSNEPAWMTALREQGADLAQQLPLPALEKTRINRWSLDHYGTYKAAASAASLEAMPAGVQALIGENQAASLIVQQDSGVVYSQLDPALAEQGVLFMSLEEALQQHADLVQPYFMQAVQVDEHRIAATHAALWNGGVFLYVPKNVIIETPIQVVFHAADASATLAPHILIVAEANSAVTYVDNYISEGGAAQVVSSVSEVFVKAGAKVRFSSVHALDSGVVDLAYRRAIVDNDGSIEWLIGDVNNGNGISDSTSLLKGNGSFSDAKILSVGSGEQQLNITSRAVHIGLNSTSDMVTRAVMRERGVAILNGVTKIEKGATGANGGQTEKILMLSPTARGDANPILLIDEDDVKCGHAASVGQVSPEQIFYMMSRGISRQEAMRLITYGFLAPVIDEIPNENLSAQLQAVVERKLGQ